MGHRVVAMRQAAENAVKQGTEETTADSMRTATGFISQQAGYQRKHNGE